MASTPADLETPAAWWPCPVLASCCSSHSALAPSAACPAGWGGRKAFSTARGALQQRATLLSSPCREKGFFQQSCPPERCRFSLAQLKRSAPQMVTRWHCSGFAYGRRETGPENDQTNGFMATSSLGDGSHLPSVVFSATATRELPPAMHVGTEGAECNKPCCLSLPIWGSRA